MTDRIKGYIVTLEQDLRTDDAEATTEAIKQIRGVLSVSPITASPSGDFIIETRIRRELGDKLWEILYPKTGE